MFIFRQSRQIHSYIEYLKAQGKSLGFIPTMGALHEGHASLIELCKANGDMAICSIFVNPTQFDNKDDLKKYPRTEADDLELLESRNCDIVFIPEVDEVYPEGFKTKELEVDLQGIEKLLEGAFRIGHFEGMMQVVHRLLEIVPAHRIYMGQKDFQQQMIVRRMMKSVGLSTELVMAPIKREEDGLAMSSRNRRISPELRPNATALYSALIKAKELLGRVDLADIVEEAKRTIGEAGFKLEYFEIADGRNLLPIRQADEADQVVALTAAWLGDVRLIDNMILKP